MHTSYSTIKRNRLFGRQPYIRISCISCAICDIITRNCPAARVFALGLSPPLLARYFPFFVIRILIKNPSALLRWSQSRIEMLITLLTQQIWPAVHPSPFAVLTPGIRETQGNPFECTPRRVLNCVNFNLIWEVRSKVQKLTSALRTDI